MAVINPDEISSILKENIRNYEAKAEVSNIGSVLEVGDGIARIYGLRNVMSNELVEFEDGKGTLGITLNLEEDNVGVVILGDYIHLYLLNIKFAISSFSFVCLFTLKNLSSLDLASACIFCECNLFLRIRNFTYSSIVFVPYI